MKSYTLFERFADCREFSRRMRAYYQALRTVRGMARIVKTTIRLINHRVMSMIRVERFADTSGGVVVQKSTNSSLRWNQYYKIYIHIISLPFFSPANPSCLLFTTHPVCSCVGAYAARESLNRESLNFSSILSNGYEHFEKQEFLPRFVTC